MDNARTKHLRRAVKQESKGGFGFSRQDVETAIDGWCRYCRSDPWRMAKLERHEFKLFLRDASKIEQGIEMAGRLPDGPPPGAEGRIRQARQEATQRRSEPQRTTPPAKRADNAPQNTTTGTTEVDEGEWNG